MVREVYIAIRKLRPLYLNLHLHAVAPVSTPYPKLYIILYSRVSCYCGMLI